MAITKSAHTPKLSLNVQHDYITLRTPNGNFTTGYGGVKASGKIAKHFDALDRYANKEYDGKGNYLEHLSKLLDPKFLEKFFPDWDAPLNVVKVGDVVKVPNFAKKYPDAGTVVSVSKKTAQIQFANVKMGFDMSEMEE